MKKTLFIGLALVVVLVIASVAWIILSRTSVEEPPVTLAPGGFPLIDNTASSTNSQDRDLLNDADVVEDPVNPGYYYLGYQTFGPNAVQDPPYLITFIKETNYFNITLLKEPLGETRASAERYLMDKLGATGEQLCQLNYTVGVPDAVNSVYSSMNLGFSFCQGAVRLP